MTSHPMPAAPDLLPMTRVKGRVGLSASMIYREIAAGRFPAPGKYGTRSLWDASEIDAWIVERIARKNMGQNMGPDLSETKKPLKSAA